MSPADKRKKKMSRRKFLVRGTLGTVGVLAVGTYVFRNPLRRGILEFANSVDLAYMGNTDDPIIWFEITEDNTVLLHSPKVEMGQGTFTGLAQIAADELEVTMSQIKVVHASTASGNIDLMSTGGSTSISSLWEPLRELAATMREMLKNEAAKKLHLDHASLTVSNGIISGGDSSITYAEAAKDVTEWDIPDTPELKDLKSYKFIGQAVPRVDLKEKVFGAPIFGMDSTMPDLLYGAVVRPTMIGATFVDADTSGAEDMPGVVKVIREEDFIGVVARSQTEVEAAKNAIKVNWNTGKNWQTSDIEAMIKVGQGDPQIIQKEGNAHRVLKNANELVSSEYTSPIGAHAQLEPNGALAHVQDGKATLLISTQVVGITQQEVADRLGIDKENVNIVPTYLGGGFGRRLHTPHAMQAAVMSKVVGKPVKYYFSRQEEFQHDMFRPPTHHVLKAALNGEGRIEAFEHNFSSGDVGFGSALIPGIAEPILGADIGAIRGGFNQYGAIPNHSAICWRVKLPFATSWWRSLGLLANTFAMESFMDELAEKAGQDPVEFRLDHIQNDERGHRLKEVIEAVADRAGWRTEVRDGIAMGFAASTDANTPCAQVAEVSLENNQIKVHKVTCAIDPGMAINPDQIRAQCEGSIIMGMSASMYEKMEVRDGALYPTIYGPYQMATMKHSPKEIEVVILENASKPGAVGEPPLGPIGAAIANAVYKLSGKRLRTMPLELS